MSGCYGNDPEDRYFEAMLHKWEDSQADEDESRDMAREREESSCDSDDI